MSEVRLDNKNEQRLSTLNRGIESGALFEMQRLLNALHPAEIADLLEASPRGQREIVWELIEPENEGEVLVELGDEVRVRLVKDMNTGELLNILKGLDVDDMADFLQSLPNTVIGETLAGMDRQDRERLESVLAWPEDTAGGLMDTQMLTVRANVTVDVVLRYLRRQETLPSHTDNLIVVDRYDYYHGIVSLSTLLTSLPEQTIVNIMDRDQKAILVDTSDDEVARLFEDYNLISAAVTDDNGILLGRITIDDVVDVIRDEAESSVRSMAGLNEDEDIFAPVIPSAKRRAIWLGTNLLTAILASIVINQFEETIHTVTALAILMPIVASMGGITGMQTLTLVTRALALGQLAKSNTKQLFNKEIMVGFFNGLIWAFVVAVLTWLLFPNKLIAIVIAAAMVINLLVASASGVLIPLMLKNIGVDPALAGSVVLTTVTDVVGFFAFLGLATWFLV